MKRDWLTRDQITSERKRSRSFLLFFELRCISTGVFTRKLIGGSHTGHFILESVSSILEREGEGERKVILCSLLGVSAQNTNDVNIFPNFDQSQPYNVPINASSNGKRSHIHIEIKMPFEQLLSGAFQTTIIVVLVLTCVVLPILAWITQPSSVPDLPGPRGWPIVGSYFQRGSDPAETYRQWSKIYGPVFRVRLGNKYVVVINSADAGDELLASSAYASTFQSRPVVSISPLVVRLL
jgi:hypothetical protein